jgi:AbrB family looped-hinge helix DNA binding protein
MAGDFHVYRVTVRSMGRITLPADLRKRHRIVPGETVTLIQDDAGLHLKTQSRRKALQEPPFRPSESQSLQNT